LHHLRHPHLHHRNGHHNLLRRRSHHSLLNRRPLEWDYNRHLFTLLLVPFIKRILKLCRFMDPRLSWCPNCLHPQLRWIFNRINPHLRLHHKVAVWVFKFQTSMMYSRKRNG
jgi:hypothetical protein